MHRTHNALPGADRAAAAAHHHTRDNSTEGSASDVSSGQSTTTEKVRCHYAETCQRGRSARFGRSRPPTSTKPPIIAAHGLEDFPAPLNTTWLRGRAERNALGTIVAIDDMLSPMAKHYHVWVRSGLVFMFKAKPYKSRAHANKVAAALRPNPDDRMVRACEQCPESRRSKRRSPRWPRVATAMAETLGADSGEVRRALVAALRHERDSVGIRSDANAEDSLIV